MSNEQENKMKEATAKGAQEIAEGAEKVVAAQALGDISRDLEAAGVSDLTRAADLEADPPLDEDVCDHCMRCVERCPAKALSGEGRIDKKRCGDRIFEYGFRYFQRWVQGILERGSTASQEVDENKGLLEMWQTFMTGNYYYCFHCQSQCPAPALYPRD